MRRAGERVRRRKKRETERRKYEEIRCLGLARGEERASDPARLLPPRNSTIITTRAGLRGGPRASDGRELLLYFIKMAYAQH